MRKIICRERGQASSDPRNPADILLGQLMRERRKFVGFSRKGLAGRLGLRKRDIKAFENGERPFGVDLVTLLHLVLKVKVGFFIDPISPVVRKHGVGRHGH